MNKRDKTRIANISANLIVDKIWDLIPDIIGEVLDAEDLSEDTYYEDEAEITEIIIEKIKKLLK